ncbi:MAG: carboxy-S-adenosyl-L-methionine synthase CmoA [Candidatus Dasytiphilus stammeri]
MSCRKDKIFSLPMLHLNQWQFDQQVADVFPDMITRSVPGYSIITSMIGKFSQEFVTSHTYIYDLGCSYGTVTSCIIKNLKATNCTLIAIDNSPAMIAHCKKNLQQVITYDNIINIIEADICDVTIVNASMVVLNFTLQFLSLGKRQQILQSIYRGLKTGGVLILSEKFHFDDHEIQTLFFDMHHNFKLSNGYSQLEINQKRQIIEKVLLTESIENHKKILFSIGFTHVELWFQYLNFGSLIALKY